MFLTSKFRDLKLWKINYENDLLFNFGISNQQYNVVMKKTKKADLKMSCFNDDQWWSMMFNDGGF